MAHRYIADLAAEVAVPPDGILSRTLHNDENARVVLFAFSAGQELTDHTSKMPAIIQVLQGEARIRLEGEELETRPGAWIHMAPETVHGVLARSPLIMLLTLLKQPAGGPAKP
jgi:quercetin dioxygenase-like cupin family protein